MWKFPKNKIVKVVHDVASHRNGICGVPFSVVLFDDIDNRRMVGVVFDTNPFEVAVFEVAKLADGDIAFGSNSWRGDVYCDELKKAIRKWQNSRNEIANMEEASNDQNAN